MGKHTLRVTIAADGSVKFKVEGIAGSSCTDATRFLEDALGGKVSSCEITDEYYQQEVPEWTPQGEG